MNNVLRWTTLICLLAAFCLATGCNTVRGVGKDIETAGKKIQKTTQED